MVLLRDATRFTMRCFRRSSSTYTKAPDMKINRKLYTKVAPYFGSLDATESKNIKELELKAMQKAGVPAQEYYSTIKPMQASYAIADHTRTLLFGISDGALPSNVGGGYNLRIILRRVFDFMDQYKMDLDIMKLIELHANDLKPLYKDIGESMNEINEVIETERKRYAEHEGNGAQHSDPDNNEARAAYRPESLRPSTKATA